MDEDEVYEECDCCEGSGQQYSQSGLVECVNCDGGGLVPHDCCEHEHWYEDEDRDHRPVHACEDCGDSILVSEIQKVEP